MNQLNQIIIEGNLVREPEVKDTAKGTKLATFTIASNRYTRRSNGEFEQEVCYFDCEAWGESANAAANKGRKGCGCRIVGSRAAGKEATAGHSARYASYASTLNSLPGAEQKTIQAPSPNQKKLPAERKTNLSAAPNFSSRRAVRKKKASRCRKHPALTSSKDNRRKT